MSRKWTDYANARAAAEALTTAWKAVPPRARAAMQRKLAAIASDECPECEICCALGICCPLGSEEQRVALTNVLMTGGRAA